MQALRENFTTRAAITDILKLYVYIHSIDIKSVYNEIQELVVTVLALIRGLYAKLLVQTSPFSPTCLSDTTQPNLVADAKASSAIAVGPRIRAVVCLDPIKLSCGSFDAKHLIKSVV